MSSHEPFYVFPRTLKSGNFVYYYQAYDAEGRLSNRRSTSKKTKAAAKEYCRKLYQEGILLPRKGFKQSLTISDFVETIHFLDYDKCHYIQAILKRGGTYSRYHAYAQRNLLKNHIIPVFGKRRIDTITDTDIDNWILSYPDKGYSNSTGNNALKTLKIIFKMLKKEKLIKDNPAEDIKPLANNFRKRDILTLEELKTLFTPENIILLWDNNLILYSACFLAALTGMRLGEIQAVQAEDIMPDYIYVYQSYARNGYGLKSTKTGKTRKIPIPEMLFNLLLEIKKINPEGFLFAPAGLKGKRPYICKSFNNAFNKALNIMGISEENRKERYITIHSLRHGLNTYMRESGFPDAQIMAITGHTTLRMIDRYSHIDLTRIESVKSFQTALV